MNFTGGGLPEQLRAEQVSVDYFTLFGAPIMRGRAFTADEDRPGGQKVALLSYASLDAALRRRPERRSAARSRSAASRTPSSASSGPRST